MMRSRYLAEVRDHRSGNPSLLYWCTLVWVRLVEDVSKGVEAWGCLIRVDLIQSSDEPVITNYR